MNIGDILRTVRKQKGYSQEYMGFALEISQNEYSRIERSADRISIKMLFEIAMVLEVDVNSVLKVREHQNDGDHADGFLNISELQRWQGVGRVTGH
ncbi:MAG: helix-turn-helix domain-containing protein [Mucilaginibacter sp.]